MTMEHFGTEFAQIRKRYGYSQRAVAKLMGKRHQLVCDIELGYKKPFKQDDLQKVLIAMKVSTVEQEELLKKAGARTKA